MFLRQRLKSWSSILSWCMYDLANQFFAVNVVSLYFVRWLTIEKNAPEFFYSISFGISIFAVAVLAPFLGAISDESGKHITELRNKLAEREFSTAQLYLKLQSPRSALVYIDALIADYPDTKFYEQAYYEKISIHLQINQHENAKNTIERYKKLFPNGNYRNSVLALEQKLEKL